MSNIYYEELCKAEEENQQLKARIAGLEKALDYAGVKLLGHKDRRAYEYVDKILCEDGPQRLAEIQADAVMTAKKSFIHSCHLDDIPESKMDAFDYGLDAYESHLDKYANQLRNEAKG